MRTSRPSRARPFSTLAATASAIRCGRMWRRASTASMRTPGIPRVNASISRARAPQPTMTSRVGVRSGCASGRTGAALVDEPAGGLGGDTGVAAIGVRANGSPELLVERRPTDEDDVVLPDAAVLERLDDDLHVRHGRRQQRGHAQDVRLVELERGDELLGIGVDAEVEDLEAGALEHHPDEVLADVVDVALDRADDDLADRLGPRLGQERPEDPH